MVMEERSGTAGFTPHAAAQGLLELESYEETLTARAFGVTLIAFALAGSATTLSYAFAAEYFVDVGAPWLLSVLWAPWIVAAGFLSWLVWSTQSVRLRLDSDKGTWAFFALFTVAYMILLGGVAYLDARLALGIGAANHNLVVLGLFSTLIALTFSWRHGWSWMNTPLIVVAVPLIAAGFMYGRLVLDPVPASLLAVFTGLFLWVGAGLYVALRG
jgi:hypothetical protein